MKIIKLVVLSAVFALSISFTSNATGWKESNGKWWYENADGSYPTNCWQTIEDEYYYFDENGYMLTNTVTPDGCQVDNSGKWIVNGVVQKNGALSDFKNGFSYGDFPKYNSFASDNGLGDTPIWIEGGFKEVEAFQLDTKTSGMQTFYLANVEDAHGNTWLLTLDINAFQPKETFKKLCNHNLCIRGIYTGYSAVRNLPCIGMLQIYDFATQNITEGFAMQYSVEADKKKTTQPSNQVKKSAENTYNNVGTYEAIYEKYASKLRSSNGNVSTLANICNEGVSKMADYMINHGGNYSTYETWAGKLYEVYEEQAIDSINLDDYEFDLDDFE